MAKTREEKIAELKAKREAVIAEYKAKLDAKKAEYDLRIKKFKKESEPTRKERTHMRLVGLGALMTEAKTDEKLLHAMIKIFEKHQAAASTDRQKLVFARLIEDISK